MVATGITSQKGTAALRRVRDLVEEHGNAEQKQRLDKIMGGRAPAPNRAPLEFNVYLAEALVVVIEMIAELKAASEATPRPRGRPRKVITPHNLR